MKVYLNLITGKTIGVSSLKDLKGNILNRGLEKDFLELDSKSVFALEHSKLINSLQDSISKGCLDSIGVRNIKKGIKDTRRWLDG